LTEEDFVEVVRDEVPAHVMVEMFVGGRRIWPVADGVQSIALETATAPERSR
jgi:hypothetical protein